MKLENILLDEQGAGPMFKLRKNYFYIFIKDSAKISLLNVLSRKIGFPSMVGEENSVFQLFEPILSISFNLFQ